jgi:hypothetical protein
MLCNVVGRLHVSPLPLGSTEVWLRVMEKAFRIKQTTDTEWEGVWESAHEYSIFKCSVFYSGKIELDETGDAYILKCIAFTGGRRLLSRYSYVLRVGRFGNRIQVGARFFASIKTGPGDQQVSCNVSTRYFPGGESGWGVAFTIPPNSAEVK